jgi:hypothetical protein
MARKKPEEEPPMKTCRLCGFETEDEGSYCPICGEEYK